MQIKFAIITCRPPAMPPIKRMTRRAPAPKARKPRTKKRRKRRACKPTTTKSQRGKGARKTAGRALQAAAALGTFAGPGGVQPSPEALIGGIVLGLAGELLARSDPDFKGSGRNKKLAQRGSGHVSPAVLEIERAIRAGRSGAARLARQLSGRRFN